MQFVALFEKSPISVDKSGIGQVIHVQFVALSTCSLSRYPPQIHVQFVAQTYSYLPIVLSGSCAAQFCGRNQQVRRNAPKRRMNFSRNRGFAPLRYAHSPQDICNKVTIWEANESQKTVFRVKAEPTSTENMPVDAARMPKEGPVGKKLG